MCSDERSQMISSRGKKEAGKNPRLCCPAKMQEKQDVYPGEGK